MTDDWQDQGPGADMGGYPTASARSPIAERLRGHASICRHFSNADDSTLITFADSFDEAAALLDQAKVALARGVELINHVDWNAFANGVTDSTGSVDEGQVIAGNILGEIKETLAALNGTPAGGDGAKSGGGK